MIRPSDRPGLARARPPATAEERLEQLHAELDRLTRPLAKCSPSIDPQEAQAARLYQVAFHASGLSGRAAAERIQRDERMHREYLRGSRAVPLDCVLRLPKSARHAFLREWLALEKELDSESPESQRGAA